MKKLILTFLSIFVISFSFAESITSTSNVDWTTKKFNTTLVLDIEKSDIKLPAGRSSAATKIYKNLATLEKDPLLTLPVDSSSTLGDMILQQSMNFESIANIMTSAPKKAGIVSSDLKTVTVEHQFSLNDVSSLLVKHNMPYRQQIPIEIVSSRPYSGIVIDARGVLQVHGEFVKSVAEPCFFPKVWDEDMTLIYERNMTNASVTKNQGFVCYSYSDDETLYQDRIGTDPLRISARKIYGANRTDPVISVNDALKIISVKENLDLLEQGKVVILLDKESLIYPVDAAIKNKSYYTQYKELEEFPYAKKLENVDVSDHDDGIHISIGNINFKPDSDELLPEENERFAAIAEKLNEVVASGEYTLQVSGHTASVGKPTGEMELSVLRAQAIINELVSRGISEDIFTYKGYGGTVPIGDNSTEEGRAQNRRVEIVVQPKTTYIQRQ